MLALELALSILDTSTALWLTDILLHAQVYKHAALADVMVTAETFGFPGWDGADHVVRRASCEDVGSGRDGDGKGDCDEGS
jgi:hypothetical protein